MPLRVGASPVARVFTRGSPLSLEGRSPVPQWGTLWENFRRDANFPPPGGDVLTGSTTAFLHLYFRMSTVCNIFSTFCFALDRPDQMLMALGTSTEIVRVEGE